LQFNAIRVPGLDLTLDTTELCQGCGNCITDTGASVIQLPLPEEDEQMQLGHVECTGLSGDFILGLPISQYYYLAYIWGIRL